MKIRKIFYPIRFIKVLIFSAAVVMNGLVFSAHIMASDIEPLKSAQHQTGKVIKIGVQILSNLLQIDPNLYLVDVQKMEDFNGPTGHIDSAVHIDLDAVFRNPNQLPHGKTLVFISTSGNKSSRAARAVADKGYVAYYLEGGMMEWNKDSNQTPESEPQDEKDSEDSVELDMGC
ncbi:rhodanese-like domain-containing protein [Desulfobacula sp.]